MPSRAFRKGSVLITCTIFLVVFMALAVGVASMSGANLQIANNQHQANQAFASAESGLEVVRYWLSRVRIPSSTPVAQYLTAVILNVREDLLTNGVSNLVLNSDGSIPPVAVETITGQSFSGHISMDPCQPTVLRVYVTGSSRQAARTIRVEYTIQPYHFPIFNYGVAAKGALQFPGNPTLMGAVENWEADIYVESAGSITAVEVGGNTNFAGDIDIGNALATVDFHGDLNIAGDHGQPAIDEHITFGADPVEFPVAETEPFLQYATGPVIDKTTNLSTSMTLVNGVIRAGTNPIFLGNVTIQGILFIEPPNQVTFTRNVSLQGIIVGDGDANKAGTNQISFAGNFASGPYPSGTQFDAIRKEIGSSILAPGFGVSFTGNFSSVNGVMAASSLYFSGNASATVKGTMISYSPDATRVDGNISMTFDRAAMVEIPAGFDLLRVLKYKPSSYSVVL
jgi:Tfp pilus assembly protein PilX